MLLNLLDSLILIQLVVVGIGVEGQELEVLLHQDAEHGRGLVGKRHRGRQLCKVQGILLAFVSEQHLQEDCLAQMAKTTRQCLGDTVERQQVTAQRSRPRFNSLSSLTGNTQMMVST